MKRDNKKELKKVIRNGIIKAGYVFTDNELEKLADSISNEIINYQKKLNTEK